MVGTLRADALAAFDASLGHRTELVHKAVVGPLTQAGYREIIEGPALVAGVDVESGLVDALLGDVLSSGGVRPAAARFHRRAVGRRTGFDGRPPAVGRHVAAAVGPGQGYRPPDPVEL